jgi:ABC-type transporter Mla MlaB component
MQSTCMAEAGMETVTSAIHGVPGAGATAEKSPVTIGYFKIKPSDGRVVFELKGDFNRNNIKGISKAIIRSQALHRKFFELDMRLVASIDMQAMTLLIISLKALRDRGTEGSVTGLAGGIRALAFELGMQYVSRII